MELRESSRTVQTSPGQAGVGATHRQTCTFPRRSEESFEVTELAPPSPLAVTGQIGPFHASSSYLLEPTADGALLTSNVELAGELVGGVGTLRSAAWA